MAITDASSKGMSLYDLLQKKRQIAESGLPSKKEFGKLMHSDSVSESEKYKIAESVMAAGGYECLANA